MVHKRLSRKIRLYLAALVIALVAVASLVTTAPAASAATVQGCHQATCVTAYTGAKNYSNHTQWVSSVSVVSVLSNNMLETWGDGFYYSVRGTTHMTWTVNRWVRSGTAICGAVSPPGAPRQIACISISV